MSDLFQEEKRAESLDLRVAFLEVESRAVHVVEKIAETRCVASIHDSDEERKRLVLVEIAVEVEAVHFQREAQSHDGVDEAKVYSFEILGIIRNKSLLKYVHESLERSLVK